MSKHEDRVSRVVRQERGAWMVEIDSAIRRVEHVRGETWPVVGDLVELRPGLESIDRVLPRRSIVVRRAAGTRMEPQVLAANADLALIVMGLDGDFNLRRLERYLAMVEGGGLRAAVLLNKRDLSPDATAQAAAVQEVGNGLHIAVLSALQDDVGALLDGLVASGETAVLLGSSGAGKSTLVNRLLGREEQATRQVRESDGRGRHTTTSRRLISMPGGWSLIDLPGLREVGLLPGAAAPEAPFGGLLELASQCRFRDCTHTIEPGCAVRAEAPPDRLESLHKLRSEAGFQDKREAKVRHRAMRAFEKLERRLNRW